MQGLRPQTATTNTNGAANPKSTRNYVGITVAKRCSRYPAPNPSYRPRNNPPMAWHTHRSFTTVEKEVMRDTRKNAPTWKRKHKSLDDDGTVEEEV